MVRPIKLRECERCGKKHKRFKFCKECAELEEYLTKKPSQKIKTKSWFIDDQECVFV